MICKITSQQRSNRLHQRTDKSVTKEKQTTREVIGAQLQRAQTDLTVGQFVSLLHVEPFLFGFCSADERARSYFRYRLVSDVCRNNLVLSGLTPGLKIACYFVESV